jgi:1-deoxy-D-xylulose-5-phosphate reductoisomerase
MIRVAVLGSTGSIGRATLRVVRRHPERFRVVGLAAHRSVAELSAQAEGAGAEVAVLADETMAGRVPSGGSVRWHTGREALNDLASHPDVDVVVNALVGAAGLEPTLAAATAGKRLALANKESLVAGGELVLKAASGGGGQLIPIDSEHSALLQCMAGATRADVARAVLTASGGPFRGWNLQRLRDVRPSEALRHPTWDMGSKITIDSATLANKALEVIEAHFLYGLPYGQIEVVVHPQSIVHSFVEFVDGSVLAQMGNPTMELPILYALSYPERLEDTSLCTYDPVASSPLTFEAVDHEAFPLFGLGVDAGRRGGLAPAVFNAGNEVAVQAFLREKIRFTEMPEVVEAALSRVSGEAGSVADVVEADTAARAVAREAVGRLRPSARPMESSDA